MGTQPPVDQPINDVRLGGGHEIVGRHDYGSRELPARVGEGLDDSLGPGAVHLRRRLVGEHHGGGVGQGDGEREPLLLASGEHLREMSRPIGQLQEVEQVEHPLPGRRRGAAPEKQRKHDVLRGGQIRDEVLGGSLPQETNGASSILRLLSPVELSEVTAVHLHHAGRCRLDGTDEIQDARLSCAARANDRREPTALDLHGHPAERGDAGIPNSVHLVDAVEADEDGAVVRTRCGKAGVHRRIGAHPSQGHSGSPLNTAVADTRRA